MYAGDGWMRAEVMRCEAAVMDASVGKGEANVAQISSRVESGVWGRG